MCCDIESDTSRQTPLRRFIPLSFVFVCLIGTERSHGDPAVDFSKTLTDATDAALEAAQEGWV